MAWPFKLSPVAYTWLSIPSLGTVIPSMYGSKGGNGADIEAEAVRGRTNNSWNMQRWEFIYETIPPRRRNCYWKSKARKKERREHLGCPSETWSPGQIRQCRGHTGYCMVMSSEHTDIYRYPKHTPISDRLKTSDKIEWVWEIRRTSAWL